MSFRNRARLHLQTLESRITPTLTPVGPAFRVNIPTDDVQWQNSTAACPDGDFLVAFHGYDTDLSPNTSYGIFVQRYHPNGMMVGLPILAGEASDAAENTSIATDSAGNFTVTWTKWPGLSGPLSWGILARSFDTSGQPVGLAFYINSNSPYLVGHSQVAYQPNGQFMVSWEQKQTSTSTTNVYVRRFAANDSPLSAPLLVATAASTSRISVASDGGYSIGWATSSGNAFSHFQSTGQLLAANINGGTQIGRNFDMICDSEDNTYVANGAENAVGSFRLNKFGPDGLLIGSWQAPPGSLGLPELAIGPTSEILVTYAGVFAQAFDLSPSPIAPLFEVSPPSEIGVRPSVAINPNGDAFFVWDRPHSFYGEYDPINAWDVYARCYAGAAARTAAPPSINGGTNGPSTADVKDVDVNFTRNVALPSNPATAFQLTTSTGTPIPVTVDTTDSTATASKMKLTFPTYPAGLPDGNYELKVLANQVHDIFGRPLDGNGDGTPGDDLVWHFHRLLGDFNGDSTVNNSDYLLFRNAIATSQPAFNLDGTGEVDQNDYLIFRNTIGNSLPAW
ncbi:MAG: hypothetical protein ACJ8C4_07560 [Gemmataceae bacterium]